MNKHHFGIEAHHSYTLLPDGVLANRKLLKETMEMAEFSSIASEWWYYNLVKTKVNYPISNFETNVIKLFN